MTQNTFMKHIQHKNDVNNFESSVVVQELELAIKRALYGLL